MYAMLQFIRRSVFRILPAVLLYTGFPAVFFFVSALFAAFIFFFFFNDTAPTEISPLPLHDALPISASSSGAGAQKQAVLVESPQPGRAARAGKGQRHRINHGRGAVGEKRSRHRRAETEDRPGLRSEEHTSELQSLAYLVCRLLLEKK